MSYGRNPFYIWSDGNTLSLNGVYVNEEVINAFLYKVLLTYRRDELKERLQNGKKAWMKEVSYPGLDKIWMDDKLSEEEFTNKMTELKSEEKPISDMELKWLEGQEDNILQILMGKEVDEN